MSGNSRNPLKERLLQADAGFRLNYPRRRAERVRRILSGAIKIIKRKAEAKSSSRKTVKRLFCFALKTFNRIP